MNHSTPSLASNHLAELRASGLSDDTIVAAGIYSVADAKVAEILKWQPKEHHWGPAMAFPFADGYTRVKLDHPRTNGKGEPIKYESPVKSVNRAYFPPNFNDLPQDVIVVTEGEKKALAISQLGIACIGLVGVWGWQQKRQRSDTGKAYGERKLIPDLEKIDWKDKTVILAFDSDAVQKPEVQMAEARFAELLNGKGAMMKVARLPADGDGKVGADDFIVAHGADAFRKILDEAEDAAKPPALSPMDWAKMFVDEFFRDEHGLELRWWRDEFYRYVGTHYVKLSESELQAIVFAWLDDRRKMARPCHANDVVKAAASLCRVNFGLDQPCFLGGKATAANMIPFKNGLVDITNIGGELTIQPHTPAFFSPTCLAYPFDPEAGCPAWEAFLASSIGDADGIRLLQQFLGLLLTPDTSFQKLLLLIGPRRSGKGTSLRVFQHLLGPDACVSPSLTSLAGGFGLWQLMGKSVAMFPDAHMPARAEGGRVVEIIKSIVGEDSLSINRKFLPFLPNCRLGVRFIITVNELPRLVDTTLALQARILPLVFPNSFIGKEDRELEGRLKAEASGILNWALGGLYDLRRTGRFTIPEASAEILESYSRMGSPILSFLDECCDDTDPLAETLCETAYETWQGWCVNHGHKYTCDARFGESLRTAWPHVKRVRKRIDGARRYLYVGLRMTVILSPPPLPRGGQ